VVIAYVPNWADLPAFSKTIDYPKLTHINIAFVNPINDDGELSISKGSELLIARAKPAGVKVLISLGGGSASQEKPTLRRYAHLLDAHQRVAFVARLAEYVSKHDYDGLDVDLEGPAINDDYGPFIAELAAALHPKKKLLTAAVAKGYGGTKIPSSVFQHFDLVNIMAYDATGPWDPKSPGQHSSIQYARENVAYWLDRGLPKTKAVLGVPFYGYGFGKAFRKQDYSYAQIVAAYPGAENADQAGSTIYYNGIPTM
jgi:GH18 family chitinase